MTGNYLYLGFVKPISSVFFYAPTPSTSTRTIMAEMYLSGSGWTSLSVLDDTMGFTRNGLIQWQMPEENYGEEVTVNSIKMKWMRLSVTASTTAMVVRAVSYLFSDDNDLKREFSQIMDASFLLGASNHFLIHESSRDEIVQKIRNRGIRTIRNALYRRLTFWDLLDVQEVRLASTYLTLSKIFYNVSKASEDDDWAIKSKQFTKKFQDAFDVAFVTYDKMQDGDALAQRDFTVGVMRR
jgi:hypothetical protein